MILPEKLRRSAFSSVLCLILLFSFILSGCAEEVRPTTPDATSGDNSTPAEVSPDTFFPFTPSANVDKFSKDDVSHIPSKAPEELPKITKWFESPDDIKLFSGIRLDEFKDTKFVYDRFSNGYYSISIEKKGEDRDIIVYEKNIDQVFFAELSGDKYPDICIVYSDESKNQQTLAVYNCQKRKMYKVESVGLGALSLKEISGRLFVCHLGIPLYAIDEVDLTDHAQNSSSYLDYSRVPVYNILNIPERKSYDTLSLKKDIDSVLFDLDGNGSNDTVKVIFYSESGNQGKVIMFLKLFASDIDEHGKGIEFNIRLSVLDIAWNKLEMARLYIENDSLKLYVSGKSESGEKRSVKLDISTENGRLYVKNNGKDIGFYD